jgi:hypothetical protein
LIRKMPAADRNEPLGVHLVGKLVTPCFRRLQVGDLEHLRTAASRHYYGAHAHRLIALR